MILATTRRGLRLPSQQDSATREALERIARDGSDLSRPMKMDFFVAVRDEASGSVMASRAIALGFEASIEQDADTGAWTCYCSKVLVPTLQRIVATEMQLDSLAPGIGGCIDGFGMYGNKVMSLRTGAMDE